MILQPTQQKVRCDVRDCKNTADSFVECKGKPGKFYLCKQCKEEIYKNIRAVLTPKSPKNTIKKIIEQKEQQQ